jgi:hypothetical protein
MRCFSALLFLILAGVFTSSVAQRPASSPAPSPAPTPPKPGLAVVLERQVVRENDELQAQIWISNEWDKPISDVVLQVNVPAFLSLAAGSCSDSKNGSQTNPQGVASIGTIAPNDVKAVNVCLRTGPDIMVGDFNVSFTCEYAWPLANGKGRSFVTTEKTLKSNLLGSDTVAGVPIALAAFIVPGLFFWLVIGWLKVPWDIGSALGDKLVYSVIVSVLLLWLINFWKPNTSGAIGLSKLFTFALAGATVGLFVGSVDHGLRFLVRLRKQTRQSIAKAAEVKLGDDSLVLLRKLLTKYPNCRKPRAVVTLGEEQYIGSLMAETDEIVAVIGWFRIARENIQASNRDEVIAELEGAKEPIELFNIATRYRLKIEPRNGIKQRTKGNESELEEVWTSPREGVTAEQHCDTAEDEVLILE